MRMRKGTEDMGQKMGNGKGEESLTAENKEENAATVGFTWHLLANMDDSPLGIRLVRRLSHLFVSSLASSA